MTAFGSFVPQGWRMDLRDVRDPVEQYGYGFPAAADRLRRLGESAQVMKAMWSHERATFEGRHYAVRGAVNEPKPLQRPHPPLWIGGGGERVTLRLVARLGDACNFEGDRATARHKLEVLERHCQEVGRDFSQIVKSTNVSAVPGEGEDLDRDVENVAAMTGRKPEEVRSEYLCGPAERIAEGIRERVEAGFDYLVVFLPLMARGGEIRRFAEQVIPLVD